MTISLSLKPLVLGSTKSNDVIDLLRPQQNKKQIHVSCACVRNMEMFLPNSPSNSLSSSFASAHVKVCGTPYTYREKASPAPVVALAVKWLTGAIMSPRLCANFVLVLVRATILASPQCEAYILAAHHPVGPHHTHLPHPVCRTYQRAFYTLTEKILISSWSLQSRRRTVEYIYSRYMAVQ